MPSSPPKRRVVAILCAGAALTVSAAACETPVKTSNPPPPPPTGNPPPPPPTGNPPPPEPEPALPAWEDVASGHPEGATNPPIPVLAVLEDGSRCWKEWHPAMRAPDPAVLKAGGRVLADAADAKGTEITCPRRRAQAVLDQHKAASMEDVP